MQPDRSEQVRQSSFYGMFPSSTVSRVQASHNRLAQPEHDRTEPARKAAKENRQQEDSAGALFDPDSDDTGGVQLTCETIESAHRRLLDLSSKTGSYTGVREAAPSELGIFMRRLVHGISMSDFFYALEAADTSSASEEDSAPLAVSVRESLQEILSERCSVLRIAECSTDLESYVRYVVSIHLYSWHTNIDEDVREAVKKNGSR
ncbi:hypothetical protein EDC01DRAFT_632865 [Geopyxis carbonaria]|nr:hypothetical protein EDC01DRAFT_632865 [Geopyxis carbonaria]